MQNNAEKRASVQRHIPASATTEARIREEYLFSSSA